MIAEPPSGESRGKTSERILFPGFQKRGSEKLLFARLDVRRVLER
jgi:hypothetical protein